MGVTCLETARSARRGSRVDFRLHDLWRGTIGSAAGECSAQNTSLSDAALLRLLLLASSDAALSPLLAIVGGAGRRAPLQNHRHMAQTSREERPNRTVTVQ